MRTVKASTRAYCDLILPCPAADSARYQTPPAGAYPVCRAAQPWPAQANSHC